MGTTDGPCPATQGPPTDCAPTNDAVYIPVLLRELSSPEWRRTVLSKRHWVWNSADLQETGVKWKVLELLGGWS